MITGTVNEQGRFIPDNSDLFKKTFIKFVGKDIALTVSALPKRSSRQNRYYWGVVIATIANCLSEASGEDITPDDAHEFCKRRFNSKAVFVGNDIEMIAQSTCDLTTTQFEAYVENIRRFASEYFAVYIPNPNEVPMPEEISNSKI